MAIIRLDKLDENGEWFSTLVDNQLAASLSNTNWKVMNEKTKKPYAFCWHEGKRLLLHRYLMRFELSAPEWIGIRTIVDHINGDSLDNRLANLRVGTASQNMANIKRANEFKGVVLAPTKYKGDRWRASITINRVTHHLGTFDTPREAAIAYNEAASAAFGEFAQLNLIEGEEPPRKKGPLMAVIPKSKGISPEEEEMLKQQLINGFGEAEAMAIIEGRPTPSDEAAELRERERLNQLIMLKAVEYEDNKE